jgi:N-acetylneuraminic acid mutarotase
MYDPITNEWTSLPKKPTTTNASIPVVYDGKIYLFGGGYSNERLSEHIYYNVVEAYDPINNEWEAEVSYMPKTLFSMAIAVHGNFAYLIGGYDEGKDEVNYEVMAYDFESGEWIRNYRIFPTDVPWGHSYATQAPVVNGKVYLIGGAEGDSKYNYWLSDKCIIFDIESKSLKTGPKLPGPIEGQLVIATDDTIYVIGGEDDLNTKDTVFSLFITEP